VSFFCPGIAEEKMANCYLLLEIAEEKIFNSAIISCSGFSSAIISSLMVVQINLLLERKTIFIGIKRHK